MKQSQPQAPVCFCRLINSKDFIFLFKNSLNSYFPSFLYSSWFYFFIFTMANSAFSYTKPNSSIFLPVIGISLFIFVMMALFFFLSKAPQKPIYSEESFRDLTSEWFWVIAVLAFLPRFFILLAPNWPTSDDGINAFIPMELSKKWSWQIFLTHSQIPPINSWIQVFYFKWITPSFFSMRLYFFILSVSAALLSFSIAKIYFSRSTALFCFFFASLGFWPLYASKFWMYPLPLFTFQIIVLGILGIYLKSTSIHEHQINGWKLGCLTGLGFWVAIQWPLAAFAITISVFLNAKTKETKITISKNISYWLSLSLLAFPFLLVSLTKKYGENIKYIFLLPPTGGISRSSTFLSNWTSLFWGCNVQNSYGPIWGGMLNPIAASLFFIGFIELIRHQRFALPRWVLWSFFISMIPGLITGTFDVFRNSLILPPLIFICALGAQSLSQQTSFRWKPFLLPVILLFAAGLDMVHLWKTYHQDRLSVYRIPTIKIGIPLSGKNSLLLILLL